MLIAANMVAEVCSLYLLRPDRSLELYATEGLNVEAVHKAVMPAGKGLVGLVVREAKPLNLANAQIHPMFEYLPGTNEEVYKSFLGVPVLRLGKTLGVLTVQNRNELRYTEEEVEALQTVTMVLAEMIAAGELLDTAPPQAVESGPFTRPGVPIAEGIGLGYAVLHEPRIVVQNLIAEDLDLELQRLEQGVADLRISIDSMLDERDLIRSGEHWDILQTYRMFAYDQGWVRRLREAVESGLTAEAAVEKVQNDTRARLIRSKDPYLRERLHDMDDLANRLLRMLTGTKLSSETDNLPTDTILIARNLGPAELLDYRRTNIRGLILEEGTATSHVAIVARAFGIPCIGRVESMSSIVDQGDEIIVDAIDGLVHVRPIEDVQKSYGERVLLRAKRQEQYRGLREKPATTLDGVNISTMINAGLTMDVPHLRETNADGIGLFRTELQFMVSDNLPRAEAQETIYREIMDGAEGKPVTFRTLDVGGDKVLPYMRSMDEENPALGWRALRLSLDRPALFRMQVRAMLKAADGRPLRIMLPMAATVGELRSARAMIDRELAHLARHKYPVPQPLEVGAMIEVPSLVYQLKSVCREVDFLSIGSNDLMQYFFAADRGNPRMMSRYDVLSTPVLRLLKHIVDTAAQHNTPLALCGEMGSKPTEVMALLAIGLRTLSMSPAAIGPVKAMILSLDLARLQKGVLEHLQDDDFAVRAYLEEFAASHHIQLR
jgi:phosphotransferase system enzyme I (PtsP)